jgi:dTDP-4-amino-4,6-dideoxygalactose transaminase
VQEFEEALAVYTGAKYAVAVNSGTAALYLAYLASNTTAVLTSPLTFVATANAALLAGAGVWFNDACRDTGLMENWECGLTTYAYVPVHYAGRAAWVGQRHSGMICIEDACHALGAMDHDGCSRVGSCAHSLATCFSFHPVKPITTGEGGAVTTNDEGYAAEVRSLRDHGRRDGLMVALGGNYRMPDISAALGLSQLKRCDKMRERRSYLAMVYNEALSHVTPETLMTWPYAISWPESWKTRETDAWHLYPIRIKGGCRDEAKAKLNAQSIGAQVHYSPIVPLHPYYRERFGYEPGMWPQAEAWAAEELSLPLHAKMTEQDVERVVAALREALG